jgi:hypothetical protein
MEFCSWNRNERKKGNKDECLSRFFGREHIEIWQGQKVKQTLVFAAFFFVIDFNCKIWVEFI